MIFNPFQKKFLLLVFIRTLITTLHISSIQAFSVLLFPGTKKQCQNLGQHPFSPCNNHHNYPKQQRLVKNVPLFGKKKKKKSGGGGKNKNNKNSGFEWASSFSLKPSESKFCREIASMAVASFEGRNGGKPLSEELKGCSDIPKALWNAPIACVVVAAGPALTTTTTSSSSTDEKNEEDEEGVTDGEAGAAAVDMVVQYANVVALETIGLEPDQFEQLIATKDPASEEMIPPENPPPFGTIDLPVEMKGNKKYESGYSKKILKIKDGDDITILNAYRWSIEKSMLVDRKFVTETIGIAYAWEEWKIGEDIVGTPGGGRKKFYADIGEAIAEQGKKIREMKEVQGLGNKDQEVIDAVQELLRLKSLSEDK